MTHDIYKPEDWGWKQEFHASWAAAIDSQTDSHPRIPARVTGKEHHLYEIVVPDFSGRPGFPTIKNFSGRYKTARVSGRFEYGAMDPSDYPVIGDWVVIDPDAESPRIQGLLQRRSALQRGSAGSKCDGQILAANIDTLFLVFALDGGRNFLVRLLERGLVVAKNSGAEACIVLNKVDLTTDEERERILAIAHGAAPNVPVIALSAKTGEGLSDLAYLLSPGETVGMLGKSGVGKSALVNALEEYCQNGKSAEKPRNSQAQVKTTLTREGEVRNDDLRGRHTTTSSHLYRLDSGILVIDSPGIRELKIWGDAEGISGGFPDIAELALRCKFANCGHMEEPGCAVKKAIEAGELEQKRYQAYRELVKEQDWLERRNDERAKRENEEKWKRISKFQKELKKSRS
jgi:ribosome biogenesis GTPase / thiamine phosphate phosphatase